MDNIENPVLEGTENVEGTTTEEIVEEATKEDEVAAEKTYTEEEFNRKLDEALGKKIARREAKIRKEYESKYGELEEVLYAGTGKNDVKEVTEELKQFYESKGVKMTPKPSYSEREVSILARAEAKEIMDAGLEDVVEEVDRLAAIGFDNMTAKDKEVFKVLAEHRQNAERSKELSKIGVTQEVYNSKEFKEFAGKFNSNTSISEIYNLYQKMQPKKEVETMGSMKNTDVKDNTVKDFYTVEEASKFTRADYDKNPELYKAVKKSMAQWGKTSGH